MLSSLTKLNLMSNPIAGTLPTEIGQIGSSVKSSIHSVLNLSAMRLTGTIPTEIGKPDHMASIALDQNSLTGTLPSEIGDMESLTFLSVFDNPGLCGSISSLISVNVSTSGTSLGQACASPPPPPHMLSPERSPASPSMKDDSNMGVIFLLMLFAILTLIGILAACILVLVSRNQQRDTNSNSGEVRRYNQANRRWTINCNQVEMVRGWQVEDNSGDGCLATRGSIGCRGPEVFLDSLGSGVSLDSQHRENNNEQDEEIVRAKVLLRRGSNGYTTNPLLGTQL